MGLVTVALLTLTPLALRPVRLACLIHAANVHSEPGSNPSKIAGTRPAPRWTRGKPKVAAAATSAGPPGPSVRVARPWPPRRLVDVVVGPVRPTPASLRG